MSGRRDGTDMQKGILVIYKMQFLNCFHGIITQNHLAKHWRQPLYRYLGGALSTFLVVVRYAHQRWSACKKFHWFSRSLWLCRWEPPIFPNGLRIGSRNLSFSTSDIKRRKLSTAVRDERAVAPDVQRTPGEVFRYLQRQWKGRLSAGSDGVVFTCMDCSSKRNCLWQGRLGYTFPGVSRKLAGRRSQEGGARRALPKGLL